MKPVLVLQHMHADGPAYLGTWLNQKAVPVELRNSEAGQEFPASIEPYAALAVLGGEMSANDDLPSLRQAERLILEAMAKQRPVIGHCLGGQLMARALGARITRSPEPEIGWQRVQVHPTAPAHAWLGESRDLTLFHWHWESFALPAGADMLARTEACPAQAFGLGMHLAMQFHIEVDEAKLQAWSRSRDPDYLAAQSRHGTVQSGLEIRAGLQHHLAAHQAIAGRIFSRWLNFAIGI